MLWCVEHATQIIWRLPSIFSVTKNDIFFTSAAIFTWWETSKCQMSSSFWWVNTGSWGYLFFQHTESKTRYSQQWLHASHLYPARFNVTTPCMHAAIWPGISMEGYSLIYDTKGVRHNKTPQVWRDLFPGHFPQVGVEQNGTARKTHN